MSVKSIAVTLLLYLFTIPAAASSQSNTIYAVDLYGLRTVSETAVRTAIGVRAGDPLPDSVGPIRARVLALAGVAEVDVSKVCCEGGRTLLYVGIRESGTPPMSFRAAPSGSVRLPADILSAGQRLDAAMQSAVRRGVTIEDGSRGYSLVADSAARAVQEEFLQIAARRFDTLVAVLHNSADAEQRALAAEIIAYGSQRPRVVSELLYAVGDPDDGVRNAATRALALLSEWAHRNPHGGVVIPAAPFIDLLNSVSWTDRNKGMFVLFSLTASRDSALVRQLRTRALQSLLEMSEWSSSGHVLPPLLVLARVAGLDDGEAYQALQSGQRAAFIAQARARLAGTRSRP